MDHINIDQLIIFANHGLFSQEKDLGQKFALDIDLRVNTQAAAFSKDLAQSVDYGALIQAIKQRFTETTYDLIESVAEDIAQYILRHYTLVASVRLRLHKPWAPVMTAVESIYIDIERRRNRAFLGLGSNLGDSENLLDNAIQELSKAPHTEVKKQSSLYQTKAWGLEDQPDFLNCVVEVETFLEAENLLNFVQTIENNLGRTREVKWGPRSIDIDILFYNDAIIYQEDLLIPHPYIEERAFVIEPMKEIAPFWIHPVSGKQMRQLSITDEEVTRL